jgi:hypothetical protein
MIKNAESDSRAFCGLNAGKSPYFTHLDFSEAKLKKSAQITLVNMVIKKNEMGGACSKCGEEEWCIQDLGGET